MSIRERIVDARFLMAHQRWEGALLCVLVAIAATAEKRHPALRDREKFELFFDAEHAKHTGMTIPSTIRIQVSIADGAAPLQTILYRWFRCKLIHEGKLPAEVAFTGDPRSPQLTIRGGSATTPMEISISHLPLLITMVVAAPENADEGFDRHAEI